MADAQVGTRLGYQAVGNPAAFKLAGITADGVNTVTVDNIMPIVVGQFIDIATAGGTVLAANRQITGLTLAGILTYSGADVTAVPGTHFVYPTGVFSALSKSNLNGGYSDRGGFSMEALDNIDWMVTRLQAANAGYWTAARIASHTVNDLVYALRLLDAPAGIR
jgi:hypothetical protein